MKRVLLFSLLSLIAFSMTVEAQRVLQPSQALKHQPYTKQYFTGAEAPSSSQQLNNQRFPLIGIGVTYYDLQSNGSCMRRIVQNPEGELSAAWTMSLDEFDASFPNRGSGYNSTTNGEWGDWPDDRLEDRRVGWPSINHLSDGSTIIINHTADAALPNGPFNFLKKSSGGTWAQDVVTSQAAPGMLWPRSVVSDNGSIHVVGITTPVANDGAIYEGVDGHLLYYRSTDGGTSWDKFDDILPGHDSSNYTMVGGDAYAIDANAGTIAIAHFADWNDITVYKSTDDGETWTRMVVNDFPLEKHTNTNPYTLDDIGGVVDTLGPGGLPDSDETAMRAIFTSDNSGTVVVDNNGKVHVMFGMMYVSYDEANAGPVFYPGWNGLAYWNEDMPAGERPIEITGALDLNGNGQLDIQIENIATYFYSLSSMPYAAIAPNNEIYLAYSAVTEEYMSSDGQNYRHIYMMKSVDGGETWEGPFDVINEQLFEDDDFLFQFVEATFPSIVVDDNNVHLVYQQDYEPGLAVRGDEDPVSEQEIIYLRVDKNLVNVERVVRPQTLGMELSPNPAQAWSQLSFDLERESEVSYEVINFNGQTLYAKDLGNMASGSYTEQIDVDQLNTGNYIVRLVVNKTAASLKLVVK